MRVEDDRVTGNKSFDCVDIIKGMAIIHIHIFTSDFVKFTCSDNFRQKIVVPNAPRKSYLHEAISRKAMSAKNFLNEIYKNGKRTFKMAGILACVINIF